MVNGKSGMGQNLYSLFPIPFLLFHFPIHYIWSCIGLIRLIRLAASAWRIGLLIHARADLLNGFSQRFGRGLDGGHLITLSLTPHLGHFFLNVGFHLGGNFITEFFQGFLRGVGCVVGLIAHLNHFFAFAVLIGMRLSILAHLFHFGV